MARTLAARPRGPDLARWHTSGTHEAVDGLRDPGLVTLAPLLIVVAAIDPFPDRGFGEWVADGMALPAHSAMPAVRLFVTEHQAAKGAGILSLALLAVAFGVAFRR